MNAARQPTKRWYPLRPHAGQTAYLDDTTRFNVVPAGRRSGKTEIAKRRIVMRALERAIRGHETFINAHFFAAAPTRDQAKRIYWQDLKALVPTRYLADKPSETQLIIPIINNVEIHVLGMDKPERFEGSPWDGGILDEYGNMKEKAWMENIFPALADRRGWCDLIGVPEGRNHYYKRYKEACSDEFPDMHAHHWKSSEILPASEIEMARRMLDELSFMQEFEAEFVNFSGRTYYPFTMETHCANLFQFYNPHADLAVCFDFNVSPGVAVICQEMPLPGQYEDVPDPFRFGTGFEAWRMASMIGDSAFVKQPVVGTAVIGEVHIPQNSNTQLVCNRIIQDWGDHRGTITLYGDATGGAKGTAKLSGSDWEIIWNSLSGYFGDAVDLNVPKANPTERARVNAMNSRLRSMDGLIRLMVDGDKAPHLVEDLEGVRLLEGGSGEIDKKRDKTLTHISDALGYYVVREFPIAEDEAGFITVGGRY